MNKEKSKGWKLLWVWVIIAFIGLGTAWYFLISIASENAPENIPLIERSDD